MAKAKGSPKTGGRKPGTPNKRTKEILERARELGVEPFEILLHFAAGNWKELGFDGPKILKVSMGRPYEVLTIDPDLRLKAAAEACQYIHAKRKAVELSGPDGGPIPTEEQLTPEEAAAELKRLTLEKEILDGKVSGKALEDVAPSRKKRNRAKKS